MREPKGTKTLEYDSFNAPGIQTFIESPCFISHFLLGTDSVSRSRDSFLHGTHWCCGDPLQHSVFSGRVPTTHGKAGCTPAWHNLHFNGNTLGSVTTACGSVHFQHNQMSQVWGHHPEALVKHHISWLSPPAPAPLYQTDTEALSCPGEMKFTVIIGIQWDRMGFPLNNSLVTLTHI